ncbi:hypothetical protein DBR17_02305 [Sphingomonas sp. HMWF008]|nr:hypothetical protein DBR17_02305 [Sphingomonas sp. HMWF008]
MSRRAGTVARPGAVSTIIRARSRCRRGEPLHRDLYRDLSSPRKRGPSSCRWRWVPAFAGMTRLGPVTPAVASGTARRRESRNSPQAPRRA